MTVGGNPAARIRVALADDHPVVLAGIKALLLTDEAIEFVGSATNGDDALALIEATGPDVAVVDISMPGLSGFDLTRRLTAEHPGVQAIVMTVHEDRAYVQALLGAGARGYLLKRSAADNLVQAVRAVAGGGLYLDPAVAEAATRPASEMAGKADGELSPRETDVLRLSSQGLANKEIAARLDLSVKSVETYKARGIEKLGLRSRADIVRHGVAKDGPSQSRGLLLGRACAISP